MVSGVAFMIKRHTILLCGIVLFSAPAIFAQSTKTLSAQQIKENLAITKDDILIERNSGKSQGTSSDGFNLYIRKKEGVSSVMLVETLKDPAGKRDNYAFRAQEYNSLNGDEIRYLDGKKLDSKYSRYSLISSTPTRHPNLGECFLIYIPRTMEWGYPWARSGTVDIAEGTFINIRTFEKKYGDYTGQWRDNPFMFAYSDTLADLGNEDTDSFPEDDSQDWEEMDVELSDRYSQDTSDAFTDIAKNNDGSALYSKGPSNLAQEINSILNRLKSHFKVDVVFAIDTTGSMSDDMEALKNNWVPSLINQIGKFKSLRLGLLCYRDYSDDYNYNGLPVKFFDFTSDLEEFTENLNSISIRGNEGGDVPEAVYEALYASMNYYDWRSDAKKTIILIGDAEPHPTPKGTKNISRDMVYAMSSEKGIGIDCIIIPN